jgi:hypothetical protein
MPTVRDHEFDNRSKPPPPLPPLGKWLSHPTKGLKLSKYDSVFESGDGNREVLITVIKDAFPELLLDSISSFSSCWVQRSG